jgi:hypothetical protein
MSAGALAAVFAAPFYGALMCVAPVITKPTVQFGVRIPPERTGATVIGDQTPPDGPACTDLDDDRFWKGGRSGSAREAGYSS